MKLKRKNTLILVCSLLGWAVLDCSTASRKEPSANFTALSREWGCKQGLLPQETELQYLLARELWRQTVFRKNPPAGKVFAVLTGDSTAALFRPELLAKYLPAFEIVNRGIGGETTVHLLFRIQEDIVPLAPRVLIIAIGGNDILGGRCLPQILANTERILQILEKALPDTTVVLASMPPVYYDKANRITPFYNRDLEQLTGKFSRVRYLDLWPALADAEFEKLRAEFYIHLPNGKVDGVHFNEAGYRAWAELLRPILAAHVSE